MENNSNTKKRGLSRRDFLAQTTGMVATAMVGTPLAGAAFAETPSARPLRSSGHSSSRPNIIFVFSDQERYFNKLPSGLSLPAHERLQRTGVTFHQHYCPAVMCTSSRSVLLTGLQTATNGMFENTDVPYVPDLSTDFPTIGKMLRQAGYYTAYKGKWHLNREFEREEGDNTLTQKMDQYGFADFYSPGDMIAHTLGGYEFDHLIAGSTITWLRRHGRRLTDEGKPWCLFVSLINPHDIMYLNTDAPGKDVQDTGSLTMHAARAPANKLYETSWDMPVPKNFRQPFDAPGRPGAHGEFDKMWGYVLGRVPAEEERWQRFNDFYINSIRSVDMQVNSILSELDALRLADRTAFVYTSDHGEMGGAHGLRGKGPFAYQQGMHLPMYVVHPDVRGGQETSALTGHIDVAPTLLALAGVDSTRAAEIAGRVLPGKDFSSVLGNPGAAKTNAIRDGVLFTYSGLVTNDGDLFKHIAAAKSVGEKPMLSLLKDDFRPNMKKRGSLRSVFDGRYKFTRYFSPLDHNRPTTIDELYQWNDVELFDLSSDPEEMVNLGADRDGQKDLILAMNAKLNAVIKAEIGIDDGRELPDIPLVDWSIGKIS
ncbi:MAG: sulfatase-like hydrolase/transferase [Gammaproteobacteria bacterium]|nr:sulfatase-like hydrolase/transferase [Gammaproteobacteria bacterium]